MHKPIPLGSTRLDSTRHDTTRRVRRVEPMHFGCVKLVEQHSSTRSTGSTRRTRLARHVELDWLDWLDTQLSLLCSLYKVILCKLFTNLMEYTLIQFILFDETNRICVCKSIKTTKLVQDRSSSAMLEEHGSSRSTRSSRLARLARQSRTCRVESSRAKWNLGYTNCNFYLYHNAANSRPSKTRCFYSVHKGK